MSCTFYFCLSSGTGGAIAMTSGLVLACCGDYCWAEVNGLFLGAIADLSEVRAIRTEYTTLINCGGHNTRTAIIWWDDVERPPRDRSNLQAFRFGNMSQCKGSGVGIGGAPGQTNWEIMFSHFENFSGRVTISIETRSAALPGKVSNCVFLGNAASDVVVKTGENTPIIIEWSMFFWNTEMDISLGTPLNSTIEGCWFSGPEVLFSGARVVDTFYESVTATLNAGERRKLSACVLVVHPSMIFCPTTHLNATAECSSSEMVQPSRRVMFSNQGESAHPGQPSEDLSDSLVSLSDSTVSREFAASSPFSSSSAWTPSISFSISSRLSVSDSLIDRGVSAFEVPPSERDQQIGGNATVVVAGATVGGLVGLVVLLALLWLLTRKEKKENDLTRTLETDEPEEILVSAEPLGEYVTQFGLSDGDAGPEGD
jgi:hypothetical protein